MTNSAEQIPSEAIDTMTAHKDMDILAEYCPACGQIPLHKGHDCNGGAGPVTDPCPRCGMIPAHREHRFFCEWCPFCEGCCAELYVASLFERGNES